MKLLVGLYLVVHSINTVTSAHNTLHHKVKRSLADESLGYGSRTRPSRRERPSRPKRDTMEINRCMNDEKMCDRPARPTDEESKVFDNADFQWQLSKWISSPWDMIEPDALKPKFQNIVDKRFKTLYQQSDIQLISDTFDKISPALRLTSMKANEIKSDLIVPIHKIEQGYQNFIWKSSNAILEFFHGSYLVFKKHIRALKSIWDIDDSFTTEESLVMLEFAIEDLQKSHRYINVMRDECTKQIDQAGDLIDQCGDTIVKTSKEIRVNNNQQKWKNSLIRNLTVSANQTQARITVLEQDIKKTELAYEEKQAQLERNRELLVEKTKELMGKIGEIKPTCGGRRRRRSLLRKVTSFVGSAVSSVICSFTKCSSTCVPTVPQNVIDAMERQHMATVKAYKDSMQDALKEKAVLFKQNQELIAERRKQVIAGANMILQADVETGKHSELVIAHVSLQYIKAQIEQVKVGFQRLSKYFNNWFKIFTDRLEDVKDNQVTLKRAKEYRTKRNFDRIWKRQYKLLKDEISQSALEWIAIGKLSYASATEIQAINKNLHEMLMERDVKKIENLLKVKNDALVELLEAEMEDAQQDIDEINQYRAEFPFADTTIGKIAHNG